ncbi:MAG: metallophosphoesterase, partial [Bacteroidetes bacterium]|nr:metallophosphoesterase [Bacteroidota bacterium]
MKSDRILFFLIVFGIILLINYLVYRTFRNFLLRSSMKTLTVNLVTRIPFAVLILPFLFFMMTGFDFAGLPAWFNKYIIIPFFAFEGAVIFVGLYLLAGKIIKLPFQILRFLINRVNFLKEKYRKIKERKAAVAFDRSRRKFLTAASAAVAGYAFVGAGLGALNKDSFVLEDKRIRLQNLPEELKGLTIALISDVHSGPFMEYGLMKHYCDVINDIRPDIILIPGDVTNSKKTESKEFAAAFRDLRAKYGVFATMGNHDYFSDADYITEVLRNESPITVLRNGFSGLKINGKDLLIVGTEDTRDSGNGSNHLLAKYINDTISKSETFLKENNLDPAGVPKLLLAHKPYMFDEVSGMNFDMMFSGHTHGGQIVFLKYADLNVS